jgi:hypothetical protein
MGLTLMPTGRGKPMLKRAVFIGFLIVAVLLVGSAQTKPAGRGQTRAVPCYSGDRFPSCTSAERATKARSLAKAKTAAVIIEATQTISCGDGSDGCFRKDSDAVATIQRQVQESQLWQELAQVEAPIADILLKFDTKNRASLQLCAYEADSNDLLWCGYRNPSIALDNDAAREIAQFLEARQGVTPHPDTSVPSQGHDWVRSLDRVSGKVVTGSGRMFWIDSATDREKLFVRAEIFYFCDSNRDCSLNIPMPEGSRVVHARLAR